MSFTVEGQKEGPLGFAGLLFGLRLHCPIQQPLSHMWP